MQGENDNHNTYTYKLQSIMSLFDFLFGFDKQRRNPEDWRSVSENRRHRARGSANWTSRDDWDCGSHGRDSHDSHDGMSGFDSYEDNDF